MANDSQQPTVEISQEEYDRLLLAEGKLKAISNFLGTLRTNGAK